MEKPDLITFKTCISEVTGEGGDNKILDAALILGNGASIALDISFNYRNLFEKAKENNYIDENLESIFNELKTNNFEEVLNYLYKCRFICEMLLPDENYKNEVINLFQNKYENIKSALIKIVREIHPIKNKIYKFYSFDDSGGIEGLNKFISQFKYVVSLNYDLTLYHICMENQDCFCDGFNYDDFNELTFQNNFYDDRTHIVYPHGNLMLAITNSGREIKLKNSENGEKRLLDSIIESWESDEIVTPLFVCEGDSKLKFRSICQSPYLTYVYTSVLANLPQNIICYGWSMSENDDHILRQILKGKKPKKLYISIYDNGKSEEKILHEINKIKEKVREAEKKIKKKNNSAAESSVQIKFFKTSDEGCWTNCKSDTVLAL